MMYSLALGAQKLDHLEIFNANVSYCNVFNSLVSIFECLCKSVHDWGNNLNLLLFGILFGDSIH